MLQLRVHRVVVGVAAPVAVDVDTELGKRLALFDARLIRRVRQRLRDVATHEQVRPLTADVIELQSRVAGDRPLNTERPLLHVRVLRVFRDDDRDEAVGGWRHRARIAEDREQRIRCLERRELPDRLRIVSTTDVRIDIRRPIDLAALSRVVEDAVPAAHDGALVAERPPRESQARRKVALRRILRVRPAAVPIEAAVADDARIHERLIRDAHAAEASW